VREGYLAKRERSVKEHLAQKPLAPCHLMPVKDEEMIPAPALAEVFIQCGGQKQG